VGLKKTQTGGRNQRCGGARGEQADKPGAAKCVADREVGAPAATGGLETASSAPTQQNWKAVIA